MRKIVIVGLVLLTVAAALPVSPPIVPHTPVDVAFGIYRGCLDGFYESASVLPTKKDIRDYVISVDKNCLDWLLIWYKPIYEDGPNIPDWPTEQVRTLDAKRVRYLTEYEDLMRSTLLDK